MVNLNKLIVIEGACDGVGKTTQYSLLKQSLIKDGYIVNTHHFPSYGNFYAKGVEEYLNGDFGSIESLSPYFINNLYSHDRAITWHKELKEAYKKGNTILLDRYTTSSLIYQTAAMDNIKDKCEFIDYITDYEYNKLKIKEPDQVIFLYAPFDLLTDIRLKRTQNDGIINDIHERDIEFMKKVYTTSMFIADYLKWEKIDCSQNNKLRTIDDIHKDIYQLVKNKK